MQHNADKQFLVLVDNNNFDERNLVEIKVPNPIPYTKAVANFDRIDGEINFKGKILCLPDANKTIINNAEKKFERLVNNTQQDNKNTKKTNKIVKLNLSDFDYFQLNFSFSVPHKKINKSLIFHKYSLKVQTQKVALQPPKNLLSNPIV